MAFPFKSTFNSLYAKLLLAFTVTVTILILGLSVLLYRNFVSASLENVNRMNTSVLSQISYSMNYLDTLTKRFITSVMVTPYVPTLLYSKEDDMYLLSNALRNIDLLTVSHDYVFSVYTVSLEMNRIASTETGGIYSKDDFYDRDILKLLQQADVQTLSSMPVARKIPNPYTPSEFSNVYTYIVSDPQINGKHLDKAVVVNIKANALRELIVSLNAKTDHPGNEIIVIDSQGTVVNHASANMFFNDIHKQAYVQKVLASGQASGSLPTEIGGKDYNVTFVSSDKPKWKFISLTSYDSFMSAVEPVKASTLLICITVLLLGWFFSIAVSRSIYSPVGRLVNTVRQRLTASFGKEPHPGDIYFLQDVFNEMAVKKDEMERKQRDYIDPLRNSWLKDLLQGNKYVSQHELKTQQDELGLKIDMNKPLRLVLFRIDRYREFVERYNEKDRSLMKFGIANIICEIASRTNCNEVIDLKTDQFVLLLETNDSYGEDKIDIAVEMLIKSIQEALHSYMRISLSASLSEVIHSHVQLYDAYADTYRLSLYRMMKGHGCLLTPSFAAAIDTSAVTFPESKAKVLLDELKLGHLDKTIEAYREFVAVVAGASYEQFLSSVLHLMVMVKATLHASLEQSNSPVYDEVQSFMTNIDRYETMDEIYQTFASLFAEMVSTSEKNKQNKRNVVITRVVKHIESQFQDKNLNLRTIADDLQMSHIYLGKMFKDLTGKAVAEYITEVRMTRVKQLLDIGGLSTKEILDQCGLEESNYFYTLFRKHFGVPLSQYKLLDKSPESPEP